jgi:hypothetical protein
LADSIRLDIVANGQVRCESLWSRLALLDANPSNLVVIGDNRGATLSALRSPEPTLKRVEDVLQEIVDILNVEPLCRKIEDHITFDLDAFKPLDSPLGCS